MYGSARFALLLGGIASLVVLLASPPAFALTIVDWRTDVGVTPDFIADGLSSTLSLDGIGLFGTPTTGTYYSVAHGNGMAPGEDQSYDHYMIIDVGNSISTTFESLDLLVVQKSGASRVFRASYIIDGGAEMFLDTSWTAAPDKGTGAIAVAYDFADFTTVEDVEFRVYWGGTAPNNGKSRVYLSEFVLNGQVGGGEAIPEPSTGMLTASGLALLAGRRRR